MKKFITIALAVAVLFSFAACQPTYKTVIGMTATTDKTNYLVGQPIDLSSINVTVRYSDGSSDNFTGNEVTLTTGEKKAVADENKLTFAYGAATTPNASAATASVSVYGYKAVSAVLSNLPTEGVSGDIDMTGITAVVKDEAGNEYELSYPDVKVTLNSVTGTGKKTLTKENVTVKTFDNNSESLTKTWEGTWAIDISAAATSGATAEEKAAVATISNLALREGIEAVYYGGYLYEDGEMTTKVLSASDFVVTGDNDVTLVGGTDFNVNFDKAIATSTGKIQVEVTPVSGVTKFATKVFTTVDTPVNIVEGLSDITATIGTNNTVSVSKDQSKVLVSSDVKISAKTSHADTAAADITSNITITDITPSLISTTATSLNNVVITFTRTEGTLTREYTATVSTVTVSRGN